MPNKTDDPERSRPPEREPSELENFVDDALGVDFKLPRTLVDVVVRPRRVADAAVRGDHTRYTRPLRLFLALFAVQALLMGWSAYSEMNSLTYMLRADPDRLAAAAAILADHGATLADADAAVARWLKWANWPITALSSMSYVLALWAMRPSMGFAATFWRYIVAANAGSVVTLPLVAATIGFGPGAGPVVGVAALAAVLVLFFIYIAIVMRGHLARTGLGLATRIGAVVLATGPVLMLIGFGVWVVIDVAMRIDVGVSVFRLLAAGTG